MTRRTHLVLVLAAAALLMGIIGLTYPTDTTGSFTVRETETPFTAVSVTDTVGTNKTNATVSFSNSLLGGTLDVVGLDNTNQTGSYYAKLSVRDANLGGGLGGVDVGIETQDGTQIDQIITSSGTIDQSEGPWVELTASSSNTIYVDAASCLLVTCDTTTFTIDVHTADTADGNAQVISRLSITIS